MVNLPRKKARHSPEAAIRQVLSGEESPVFSPNAGQNRVESPLDRVAPTCHNPLVPTFAIHCIDKPLQQELRAATRARHLAYLEQALEQIVVAGPMLNEDGQPIGSLLVMEFADRRAAVNFAASDPYARAGLYASVAVTAWRQTFPHVEG